MPQFIRRLAPIKPGELPALLWSAAYFFCILFAYYLLRPYRDEMGIRGDLKNLPWLWTGTTFSMLVAAPLFAWLVSRTPRRRFIPITYLFFAANLVAFYVLFLVRPAKDHIAIGYTFYIWLSVFNLFMTSLFWGFMADIHSTEQAKRLFGAIGVGGTLGAIGGSAVPATLVSGITVYGRSMQLSPVNLLPISVVFLVLAVFCVRQLVHLFGLGERGPRADPARDACESCGYSLAGLPEEQGKRRCPECAHSTPVPAQPPPRREPGRGVFTGFILLARSPYLLTMCVYMLLFTITSTFLQFEQARIVKASFTVANDRVAYLASIDLYVNLLTLGTQLFLTAWILTKLGLIVGLLTLPVVTAAGFALIARDPSPLMLMLVMVARRGLHYAVDRPSREVLYTVLGPEEKYKSKSFIDTFVYRGGDLVGAWTDTLLNKVGIAVTSTGIVLAVAWSGAGVALDVMNKRLVRRASRGATRASASS